MKSLLFTILLLVVNTNISAQKVWSLDQCFQYALSHNVSIKQIGLSKNYAENTLKQSKMNIYMPYLNGVINESFNFGNSIDPTTYQFVNKASNSTYFGLNLNYSLFEGLSRLNTIKSNKEKLSATDLEIEELKNNTKLVIANLYLQIIIAKDVLKLSQDNKLLTQNQYDNTKALVDAGVQAQGTLLDIDAQLAQNDMDIINAESSVERALNQLKILLQIDPYEAFDIEEIDLEENINTAVLEPKNIAASAMEALPNMKAAELKLKAAEYDLKAAKGSLIPTLSMSASVGSNYFSEAQAATGETEIIENIFPVLIDGTIKTLDLPDSEQPIFGKKSFGNQFADNLNESISFSLNIPILGAWQRRTAINNAKLNIMQNQLEIDSKRNQINEDVFNAYTDLKIAKKKFDATARNITASNEAFKYANEKFKAGIMNSLEYEVAKNRKMAAQAERVQAKYELFFRKVILDYYETGKLNF